MTREEAACLLELMDKIQSKFIAVARRIALGVEPTLILHGLVAVAYLWRGFAAQRLGVVMKNLEFSLNQTTGSPEFSRQLREIPETIPGGPVTAWE